MTYSDMTRMWLARSSEGTSSFDGPNGFVLETVVVLAAGFGVDVEGGEASVGGDDVSKTMSELRSR